MTAQGIQLDRLQIKQNYRALNFLVRGVTRPYGNYIEVFEFTSNSQPTVFARPVADNVNTASHYLVKMEIATKPTFWPRLKFLFSAKT
ncbi:hypothetical protein [Glaesserella parasuis]|uniref:hypothetical protein n=1 Tax=Glaesserella parasuis TaxID=738 RepID=UPI0013666BF7|nr:hypothetical protein [Glaesserella parasuis]MWQ58462.1 hypothetical protein [Glaesserella parasuis]